MKTTKSLIHCVERCAIADTNCILTLCFWKRLSKEYGMWHYKLFKSHLPYNTLEQRACLEKLNPSYCNRKISMIQNVCTSQSDSMTWRCLTDSRISVTRLEEHLYAHWPNWIVHESSVLLMSNDGESCLTFVITGKPFLKKKNLVWLFWKENDASQAKEGDESKQNSEKYSRLTWKEHVLKVQS